MARSMARSPIQPDSSSGMIFGCRPRHQVRTLVPDRGEPTTKIGLFFWCCILPESSCRQMCVILRLRKCRLLRPLVKRGYDSCDRVTTAGAPIASAAWVIAQRTKADGFNVLTNSRIFLYAISTLATCFTRCLNAVSIAAAATLEVRAGEEVSFTCLHKRIAFSSTEGLTVESPITKSSGTLELLIRSESGSRHCAQYGSSRKSSTERIAASRSLIRSANRIR